MNKPTHEEIARSIKEKHTYREGAYSSISPMIEVSIVEVLDSLAREKDEEIAYLGDVASDNKAEISKLREAIRNNGTHSRRCTFNLLGTWKCNCWLSEALTPKEGE